VVVAALFLMLLGERGRRIALQLALGPTPVPGAFIDYMSLIQKHYRPRRDRLPILGDEQLQALTTPLLVIAVAKDRMLDSRHGAASQSSSAAYHRHFGTRRRTCTHHWRRIHSPIPHRWTRPIMQEQERDHPTDPQELRAALRRDLASALKARQTEAVAAQRTAIATGVGSTEVPRRNLSIADLYAILHNQANDYTKEADRYQSLGQLDAAQRLRREVDTLRRYL
jgi:hypothetical protein